MSELTTTTTTTPPSITLTLQIPYHAQDRPEPGEFDSFYTKVPAPIRKEMKSTAVPELCWACERAEHHYRVERVEKWRCLRIQLEADHKKSVKSSRAMMNRSKSDKTKDRYRQSIAREEAIWQARDRNIASMIERHEQLMKQSLFMFREEDE